MKDNKLIAEFMGVELKPNECGRLFRYHKEWNWLMPVIEKCGLLNQKINVTPGKSYHYAMNSFGWDPTKGPDLNIDFSYKSVVEFIKLYNQVL